MKRAILFGLALSFAWAVAEPLLAADRSGEDRLRRRVKRFYVLNYLNRYGEMWEMFSADLRERLGGDRQAYVRSSRVSGFELYSSRIEDVKVKGDAAAVEVVVQAQLAGTLEVDNRRHRMLWRFEDKDWRYAGSVDVTYSPEAEVDAAELQPPSRARAPEIEGQELLPPRVRVDSQPPRTKPEAETAKKQEGERWDLVAVPPPGRSAPAEPPEAAPEPATEAAAPAPAKTAPAPAPAATPEPQPAPAAEKEPERVAVREYLPPEMASAPPPPPEPEPAAGTPVETAGRTAPRPAPATNARDFDEGSRLVRKAMTGLAPRRARALDRLRELNDARLAPLMARALPDTPPATAKVFLAEIARYRAVEQLPAVAVELGRKEPGVRGAAARTLRLLGGKEQLPALERALGAEGDDAAFGSLLSAHAVLAGESAAPRIAAALADAKAGPNTRTAAARAAGSCGCPELEEPLLALIRREPRSEIARVALLAAGRLGGSGSVAFLESVATRSLRLPAETGDDLDGVLEARRGLALAGVAGAGEALSELVLFRGMSAVSEDVVRIAATGELEALLALLAHPEPAVRRRTAQLIGRVVETSEDAGRALAAVERALIDENDTVALDALLDARERLQGLPAS